VGPRLPSSQGRDLSNAGYWYRQAGKPQANVALEKEWRSSVPCSIKSINEDDEEMKLPAMRSPQSASDLTFSSGPPSIWPNALAGQQQSVCEQQPTSAFASRLLSGRALILGSGRRHRQEPSTPCPTAQVFSVLALFLSLTA
jgi:hypothetical protein